MSNKVNLVEKLSEIPDFWNPRIVGALNGQLVKLAKIQGVFDWHSHAEEDELFMVVKGRMKIEFRDRIVDLDEGEIYIVPAGVEHRPSADHECHILLFEPDSTINTGDLRNQRIRIELEEI